MTAGTVGGQPVVGRTVAGVTLGAAVVGLAEAALITVERDLVFDPGLVFFALLFYGGLGLAVGLGAGVGLAVLTRLQLRLAPATVFALGGAVMLAALGVVIARFRVFRDVLHETFDGAAITPAMFQLGSLVLFVLLLVVAFLALRAMARQAALSSPLVVVGVLALAMGGSWAAMTSGPPPRGPARPVSGPAPTGPSTLLIMVDTLRADHLSCYGYDGVETPAIDRLARDGTRFARAFAQASWTRPSVATLFTSLYPSSHGAVHKSDVLSDDVVTVAEAMQAAGYRTVGFPNNINVAPLFNFQQGFDEYEFLEPAFFFGATESAAQLTLYNQLRVLRERYLSETKYVRHYYQPGEVVSERALAWIDAADERPFFMFLHYMEPHDPYFSHPYDGQGYARVADPNPDPSMAERYIDAYDEEIRHLDGELEKLFEGLRARGLYDRMLIVLTADHGEEFQEHGGWWHGVTLYEEQIAVPLIVKPPHGNATEVVNEAIVSLLDVAPTMLATVGVPVPETMQGKPLGLGPASPAPRDHAFAEQDLEGNVLATYRGETWKLIDANPGNPRGLPERQLFDLSADPGEQNDRAAAEAAQAETLAANLAAVRTHAQAIAVESDQTEIDGATEERLRALGYVH